MERADYAALARIGGSTERATQIRMRLLEETASILLHNTRTTSHTMELAAHTSTS
jgi:hypothetical protein